MENLRDLFFSGRFNNTFPDDLPIIGRVIEVIEHNGNSFSYMKGIVTYDGEYSLSSPTGIIIKSLIDNVYREDHEDEVELNDSKWRYPDMYNAQLKHKILQRKIVQRGIPSLKTLATRQLSSNEMNAVRTHTNALGERGGKKCKTKTRKCKTRKTLRK